MYTQRLTRWLCDKAGDTGSIPGFGRGPGEGNGNPFQWTEETGRLQSMGSQKIGHNLATRQQQCTHIHTCMCNILDEIGTIGGEPLKALASWIVIISWASV